MSGSPDAPRLPETHRLVHVESCGSTNSEAMRLGLAALRGAGEPLPLWVLADRQTAGRGRSGRAWQSLPGNLLASLAVPLTCPPAVAAELSLVAGNAVIDAVRAACPDLSGLRLKWPNDLLLAGAKLGGILVESAPLPPAGPYGGASGGVLAVVGIGLNLAAEPRDVDRPAARLGAHASDNKNNLAPIDMLGYVGEAMQRWLSTWDEGRGLARVREGWLERAGPEGEPMTVHAGARLVSGTFAGLDRGGALLLTLPDGRIERFMFGDVTLTAT